MGLKEDIQSDFDTMLADLAVNTTIPGTTSTVTAIRNSMDKDIAYSELSQKSVEYKFTLWYDVSDITATGASVPDVNNEITVEGVVYKVGTRNYDPLEALVAFDMVEQYG